MHCLRLLPWAYLLCFTASVASAQGRSSSSITRSVAAPTTSSHEFELGLGVGFPGGTGAQLGYWGPVVVRGSLASIGIASSADLEVGWQFDRDGDFRQYVGVGAWGVHGVLFWGFGVSEMLWFGGGPRYGIRYRGFTASVGVDVGSMQETGVDLLFLTGQYEDSSLGAVPFAKLGYSWYF